MWWKSQRMSFKTLGKKSPFRKNLIRQHLENAFLLFQSIFWKWQSAQLYFHLYSWYTLYILNKILWTWYLLRKFMISQILKIFIHFTFKCKIISLKTPKHIEYLKKEEKLFKRTGLFLIQKLTQLKKTKTKFSLMILFWMKSNQCKNLN